MIIEDFKKAVSKLGIEINNDILEKLNVYYEFLNEYNSHTNLTAITEKEDIYLKHFYDSLTATKVHNFSNDKVIDIGSGAGFPGIVLKIFFPGIDLTVLDSNNKKTTFLKELCKKLNINVNIINERAEDFVKKEFEKYDVVISRAVAYMDIIISLSMPFVKKDGSVILMKGDIKDENKILIKHQKDLNIKSYRIESFYLANGVNLRNLVVIKKDKESKKILTYAQILKQNERWK